MSNIFNTPDTTANYSAADIQNNKVMAVLSYIGILVLVPIFAAKDSPFARFHANQGLILFLAEVIFGVANVILTVIFAFLGPIALLWSIVAFLVYIAFLVLLILGIINAAQGQAKELPLIGKIRILQ
ncbi:MAG: zinc ribbon domain-containing protein [Candidatus Spyradocola sp.]